MPENFLCFIVVFKKTSFLRMSKALLLKYVGNYKTDFIISLLFIGYKP